MKKSTWIVLGVVAVLGLIYKLTREEKVSVGVKHLELPGVAGKDVDRLEISGADNVKLKKVGDVWKLEMSDDKSPNLLAADASRVQEVIDAASSLRHSYYVTKQPEKLAELGFSDNKSTIVKLFTGDKVVWALELGANATNSGRYAKLVDDPNIYVVKGGLEKLRRNSVADFRDKNILKVEEAELTSLTLKRNGKVHLVLKRDAGGENWLIDESQVTLPKSFRAKSAALANLVRSNTSLIAQGFVDEKKELTNALLTIETTAKDGKTNSVEFFAGGSNEGYLVKKSGDDQIFDVSKANFDRLNKELSELRDLSVIKFAKDSIVGVTVTYEKVFVDLAKSDGKWQIKKPAQLPAGFEFDEETVGAALSRLSHITAERLAEPSRDVPKDAAWLKVPVIELKDDKGELIKIFAGKTKKPGEYIVKGNIDQELYILKASEFDILKSGIDAFKKQDFELPPIDENTKGFESLPPDVRKKLLDMSKKQAK